MAAFGADVGGCADEKFGVGVGRDHGADVPSVEHCAARLCGKAALALQQRGAHQRMRRDDRGERTDFIGAQDRILQQRIVEIARCDRIGLDRPFEFEPLHVRGDRAVQQAGV